MPLFARLLPVERAARRAIRPHAVDLAHPPKARRVDRGDRLRVDEEVDEVGRAGVDELDLEADGLARRLERQRGGAGRRRLGRYPAGAHGRTDHVLRQPGLAACRRGPAPLMWGGEAQGAGRIAIYTSEGNNYTAAGFARRFAPEVARQLEAAFPGAATHMICEPQARNTAAAVAYAAAYVADALATPTGLFNPSAVAKLAQKARAGAMSGYRDNVAFIGILSTQIWHRQFTTASTSLTDAA